MYYVYIMTNFLGTSLYTVTNNMAARVVQHRNASSKTFTGRYKVTRLVYVEATEDVRDAIQREKQIKGWSRRKKIELIVSVNPQWEDLTAGWLDSPKLGSGEKIPPASE